MHKSDASDGSPMRNGLAPNEFGRAGATGPTRENPLAVLAHHLEALGSVTRLELLQALRTPKALHEIRLSPSPSRGAERPGRPMSRQAVKGHLVQLESLGLVRRKSIHAGAGGDVYMLNHERLFATTDEFRNLAKLRPLFAQSGTPEETMVGGATGNVPLPAPPRLMVAYGRDDGVAYALHGPAGTRWTLGRGPSCAIRLDYDPYLSGEHCVIVREERRFELLDGGSKNGTWLNWARLRAGEPQALTGGDLISVGRSTLVFRA